MAVTLHWLTAALVLIQFGLSQLWGFFPRPDRHLMIVAHMSFGTLLAAVIAFRIVWRLMPGHAVVPADTGWRQVLARLVHALLYLLLAAEAVLGFTLRWSGGEAMNVFGMMLPPPFAPWSKESHHLVGDAHSFVGWTIVVLAAGHACVAIYHHWALRDGVLRRMLPDGIAGASS